jgi:hypothetical protein
VKNNPSTNSTLSDLRNDTTKVLTILETMKDVPERLARIEIVMRSVAKKNGIEF